jgi:hypothetical protein
MPEGRISWGWQANGHRVIRLIRTPWLIPHWRREGFVPPPFSMTRMTWIKPSFLWMMYRAGWGRKDDGQSRILGSDIRREGFDWTLRTAQLAREQQDPAPVIVQWDPERDVSFAPLACRSLQMGLRSEAVNRHMYGWIVESKT